MRTVKTYRDIGEPFYTVSETAKILRASVKTVYRWIELMHLRAIKVEEGYGNQSKPHIVVPESAIKEFIENHITIGQLKILVNNKDVIANLFKADNPEEVKRTAEFIYKQLLRTR